MNLERTKIEAYLDKSSYHLYIFDTVTSTNQIVLGLISRGKTPDTEGEGDGFRPSGGRRRRTLSIYWLKTANAAKEPPPHIIQWGSC